MLFSRSKIWDFVVHLDNAGIGPSGLMTKLRRLVMAIKYIGLSSEDVVTDNEVMEKARPVEEMISQLCVGLSKEKNLRQCNNLQRFSRQMPDLAGVNKFLTSPEVSTEYAETVTEDRSGIVSTTKLSRAMTIVAGRLMLRYVDPFVLYVVMIAVYAIQKWTETGGQRPGSITGMIAEEFDEGMRTSDASYLMIMVADHKSKKPAKKIAASKQLLLDLIDWMHILCPLHVPHGCSYVFSTEKGGKVAHFSRSLTVLADEFNSSLPAATKVRKATANKGGGNGYHKEDCSCQRYEPLSPYCRLIPPGLWGIHLCGGISSDRVFTGS